MARKPVRRPENGPVKLPYHTPVLYKFLTHDGNTNDPGVARRDRAHERVRDHLPGGKAYVPGAKVRIDAVRPSGEAETKESQIITRTKSPRDERDK